MTTFQLKQMAASFITLPAIVLVAACVEVPVEVAISDPDPDLVFVRVYQLAR